MKITICDDDRELHPLLAGYIKDFFVQNKPELLNDIIFSNFFCGEEFLKNPHADILFTDIYMDSLSGIDMLQRIPKKYHPRYIIFITTSRDFAIEAFQMNAVHYLVKPFTKEDVFTELNRCQSREAAAPVLAIHVASGLITIPLSSIQYIESFNKRILIHTPDQTLSIYDSLAALTKQLDQRFMQPHRSYIISMAHITAFYYDHLVMDSGLEITLSRKKRAALKEQYHHYLSEITRGEYSL